MATNVYIDGFNFYYGLGRVTKAYPGASYKWVDVEAVALTVWPHLAPINRIRYFTALVHPTPTDAQMPVRQQVYIRALKSRNVNVHLGLFKQRTKVLR